MARRKQTWKQRARATEVRYDRNVKADYRLQEVGSDEYPDAGRVIEDLIHYIDDTMGPEIALLCRLNALGLNHLASWKVSKHKVRAKSKRQFKDRYGVTFDIRLNGPEVRSLPWV